MAHWADREPQAALQHTRTIWPHTVYVMRIVTGSVAISGQYTIWLEAFLLRCDNGHPFSSKAFKDLCEDYCIDLHPTIQRAWEPLSEGLVVYYWPVMSRSLERRAARAVPAISSNFEAHSSPSPAEWMGGGAEGAERPSVGIYIYSLLHSHEP